MRISKAYDRAVAKGYRETFDVWKLKRGDHSRTTGDLRYISSLKRKERPQPEDMILMRRNRRPSSSWDNFKFTRHVIFQGKNLGLATVQYGSLKSVTSEDSIWVRPYFDPIRKVLELQGLDGSDLGLEKPLHRLAIRFDLRPLLKLAHAEGDLDRIPDDTLRSLRFDRVRDSGFAVYSASYEVAHRPGGWVQVRIPVIHGQKRQSIPVSFGRPPWDDYNGFSWFPYIGDSGLMHIWDVEENRNIQRSIRGSKTSDGFSAEEVRRRWPALFDLAQKDGFWK